MSMSIKDFQKHKKKPLIGSVLNIDLKLFNMMGKGEMGFKRYIKQQLFLFNCDCTKISDSKILQLTNQNQPVSTYWS